jgi:glutamate carboxypeptidase
MRAREIQELQDQIRDLNHERMVTLLEAFVRLESPSHDKPGLDNWAVHLARLLGSPPLSELMGSDAGSVELVTNAQGGDHVLARFPGPTERRPALVLGHFDTVWPKGTLETMPFRIEGNRAFGPGIFDMKAGLAIFVSVMLDLGRESRRPLPRPIWALFTSDEEIGSPTSRGLIEELARQCAYCLVLEPPLGDGSLKTARKGVGRFRIEVQGRAAHSGVAPQDGRSAIVELAHQVLRIQDLQDLAAGTTINVGVIQGGTTANVVPARASAEIDVRVASQSEADRIAGALQALRPVTSETRLEISGGFTRPPMERSPAIAALFEQARRIGRTLGLELTEGSTGGGSDGNFTAALGVPTLDGLGARGGGAHADDEHILIDSLPERAALLGALLLELQVEA